MPVWLPKKDNEGRWIKDPNNGREVLEKLYEGLVVDLKRSSFGGGDEDLYAVVWDDKENKVFSVVYDTSRGYLPGGASIDATPEVKAKYDKILADAEAARWQRYKEAEAKRPTIGKLVKVVSGRKVPIGTTGTIFWIGPDHYNPGNRVGIRDDAGEIFWLNDRSVEVILS